jgi:hypothetical protein
VDLRPVSLGRCRTQALRCTATEDHDEHEDEGRRGGFGQAPPYDGRFAVTPEMGDGLGHSRLVRTGDDGPR